MAKIKKQPNYQKRAKIYKVFSVLTYLIPAGAVIGITTDISMNTTTTTSPLHFSIAGITVLFILVLDSLGQAKKVIGNKMFTLCIIALILFLIRSVVDEMLIAVVSMIVGAGGSQIFTKLSNNSIKHLEKPYLYKNKSVDYNELGSV